MSLRRLGVAAFAGLLGFDQGGQIGGGGFHSVECLQSPFFFGYRGLDFAVGSDLFFQAFG